MKRAYAVTQSRGGVKTVVFCALAALCEGIDLQAAGVAAAGIGAEFKPAVAQLGTFFSASTLGLFFGAIVGGRLADSMGRKQILAASVGLFGFFSLASAFASDMQSLIWARVATGIGLGGALPMLLALVVESSEPHEQGARVAMVYAATPLGGAGASLISLLGTATHWRMVFIVGGIVPLMLAPLMVWGLDESRDFLAARAAGRDGDDARSSAAPQAGSFGALFAAGRARRTLLLWSSFFLGLLLLYLLLNWLPTLLISDGFTRSQASAAQIGFNLGGVCSALLIGLSLRGRLRGSAVAIAFVAIPILLVILAHAPAEIAVVATVVFLLGCAVLAAQAFLYAMAPIAYSTRIRGVGVGTAVAVGRIGSIVGPKLGGILKAAGHAPSQLLMDLLPIVMLGSISALWLAWETSRHGALSSRQVVEV